MGPVRAEVRPSGPLYRLQMTQDARARTYWCTHWADAVRLADLATRGNGPLPLRVARAREDAGTALLETW